MHVAAPPHELKDINAKRKVLRDNAWHRQYNTAF